MTTQMFVMTVVFPAIGLFLLFGKGDGFRPKIQRAREAAAKRDSAS